MILKRVCIKSIVKLRAIIAALFNKAVSSTKHNRIEGGGKEIMNVR